MNTSHSPAAGWRSDAAVDALFITSMSVVALYSFRSSFGGVAYLLPALLAVLGGLWLAHASAHLRLDPMLTAVVVFVGYLLVVAPLALRDRATAGLFVSVDTMRSALDSLVHGWKRLLTTSPPVGTRGGLVIVPVVCAVVCASVGYSCARRTRSPWVALLPIYATLALGILCGVDEPVSTVLHGALLTVLAICWMSLRHQRARPIVNQRPRRARLATSALMLGCVALGGLLVGPHLPMVQAAERTVWRAQLHPPFDPSTYPSPLNGYRAYLKTMKEAELFTIEGLPDGVPIRLATLDVYDGLVWQVSGKSEGTSGLFERVGDEIAPDFGGEEQAIHVRIGDGFPRGSIWIPTVGEVRSIEFDGPDSSRNRELTEAFRYNRTTDAAASPLPLRPGDEYTMSVALPTSADSLASLGSRDLLGSASLADVTAVASVTSYGSDIKATRSPSTRLNRAVGIVNELAARGFYNDPSKEGNILPSGHGAWRLDRFVGGDNLVGDAEQYAATAGLILASQELPARVVVGFARPAQARGAEQFTIVGENAEAWVEVPVDGVGWVALTPTPPRLKSELKVEQTESPPPPRPTQVPPPPPNVIPEVPIDPASVPVAQSDRSEAQEDALTESGGSAGSSLGRVFLAASPLLVVLSAVALILGLKFRRARRRSLVGAPSQRMANGWRELVDVLRDMGHPLPHMATRAELAAFSGLDVGTLARGADEAVFGPGEPSEDDAGHYWSTVRSTMRDVYSELPVGERWKARLSLTSLLAGEA